MAGFEFISSRAPTPGPQALPQLDDGSATAAGAVRFGQAVSGVGSAIQEAQGSAQEARATTSYLTQVEDKRKELENDKDPNTLAKRWSDSELKIRQDVLGSVSDPARRAALETRLTRYGISSAGEFRSKELVNLQDANGASLATMRDLSLQRASRAATPVQREVESKPYFEQLDDSARRGLITLQQAQERKTAFQRTTDDNDALKAIAENPQAAAIALEDPQRFQSLTPEVRQARLQQAQAAAATLYSKDAENAARFDPPRGIAMVGRVTDLQWIPGIVKRALIPQESSGNPDAQSPKGAAGLTQFMPDTARAVAQAAGRTDLVGLDDAGVRATLKAKPELAEALAVRHMSDLTKRYEGRLAPVFAAYHAGSGAADKWHQAALAKFGPGYSVSDFISVVPDSVSDGQKKTKDYVGELFQRLGADPARAPRMSQAAVFQAASAVGSELDSQLAAQKRILGQLASVSRDDAGSIVSAWKQGYAQDPQLVAQTRATLTQAAAAGDAASAKSLRELDYVERVAPGIREAFNRPPAQLEAWLAGERSRMATAAHVTVEERERFDAVQSVADTIARERNINPVGLLERSGAPVIPMPGQLDAAQMPEALARRGQQAEAAAQRFEAELKPFKSVELPGYKAQFDQASSDQRYRVAETAARSMSDASYTAAMTQLGADKLTIIAGRLGATNPALGEKVARGAALMKQAGVDDGKTADLKTALARTLAGSVYPRDVQPDLVDAALAAYVADRDGKGALFDPSDPKALETAIESVTGKLIKVNGVKVPMPDGVTQGLFESAWQYVDAAYVGGPPKGADGKSIDLEFLRSHARLHPDGFRNGRYLVMMPGPNGSERGVLDAQGKALVVDLMPAIKRAQSAWPGRFGGTTMNDARRNAIYSGFETGMGDAIQQRLADLEAERDAYSKARVPAPDSILGRQIHGRIERDLAAARAELERRGR